MIAHVLIVAAATLGTLGALFVPAMPSDASTYDAWTGTVHVGPHLPGGHPAADDQH